MFSSTLVGLQIKSRKIQQKTVVYRKRNAYIGIESDHYVEDFYGLAGIVLILFGWLIETYRAILRRRSAIPLLFALLYFAGSVLLGYHAVMLNDMPFIILNAAAAVIALINAYYSLKKGKTGNS